MGKASSVIEKPEKEKPIFLQGFNKPVRANHASMPDSIDKDAKKKMAEQDNQVFPFSTDNLKTVNETSTPQEKDEESGDPTSSAVPLSSDKPANQNRDLNVIQSRLDKIKDLDSPSDAVALSKDPSSNGNSAREHEKPQEEEKEREIESEETTEKVLKDTNQEEEEISVPEPVEEEPSEKQSAEPSPRSPHPMAQIEDSDPIVQSEEEEDEHQVQEVEKQEEESPEMEEEGEDPEVTPQPQPEQDLTFDKANKVNINLETTSNPFREDELSQASEMQREDPVSMTQPNFNKKVKRKKKHKKANNSQIMSDSGLTTEDLNGRPMTEDQVLKVYEKAIADRLENQRKQELEEASQNMTNELKTHGRCPVCTLYPPCNHYKRIRDLPRFEKKTTAEKFLS